MISVRSTASGVALGALILASVGFGTARAQTSNNVIFKSNLDQYSGYNDIWGYTAPNGDEYALLGTTTGLSVVNLVDPENPYETGFFSGATSTWRDIKTYQEFAYVVNESSGGLMIVDLSDPENPFQRPTYNGFSSAHNLYIDVPTARAFIAGSNLGVGGCRILSLANPVAPTEVGSWEGEYFHDIMVQDNRLYGSAIYNDRLRILDVTNHGSISILGTISGYPNAFTHNAWPTADGNYVMTTDETSGAACRLWDISSLPSSTQTDLYQPNGVTIPHNAHIDGDLAIISYYTLGVRIVDISNPNDIQEVGYYDTWPSDNGATFDGCWGAFPFFGTNEHLIVASDLSTGLYVLEYRGPLGTVAGEVTETGSPSTKIAGARLEIVQTGASAITDASGQYSLQDTGGTVDVEVSAYGYVTDTVPVTIIEGTTVALDVALDPVPSGSLSGTVTSAVTSLPVPGAAIEIMGTPLVETSDASGNYAHALIPEGIYTARATALGYNGAEGTVEIADGQAVVLDFPLNPPAFATDFESDPGWAVSGTASTGQWERADPQPTNGGQTQTGDDHTPSPGVNAWITGPLAGSSVGSHDVDDGATILTTPPYDASGVAEPRASYWRWYVSGYSSNPSTDIWVVEVSSNGGSTWVPVESTDQATPAWVNVDFALSDYIAAPYDQVAFRFTAQDTGAGSITEAGVDDFQLYGIDILTTGTDVPAGFGRRDELLMTGGFPNPFRAGQATVMSLTLPAEGRVTARVYDVSGRRVATLLDDELPAGSHRLEWGGRDDLGRLRAAGVYFVKLHTDQGSRSQKLLLIR